MKRLVASLTASISVVALANEWYVDANNGNDAWDGSTSNLTQTASGIGPRKTLKGAMEIPSLADFDTVWLLPGDYKEGEMSYAVSTTVEGYASTNRCYITKAGLRIRSTGGKAVTFVTGAKDPTVSFASAYGGIRCFGIAANATNVVIEGVTMRDGHAAYKLPHPHYSGGGVMDQSLSAWVIDCLITQCRGARGGGVYGASLLRSELITTEAEGRGAAGESVPWMVNSVIWSIVWSNDGTAPIDTNPKIGGVERHTQVINSVIKSKSTHGISQDANLDVYNSILIGGKYGDGSELKCVYTRCVVGSCTKSGGNSNAECVDCITNVNLDEVGFLNSSSDPRDWRVNIGPAREFGDASYLANVPVPEGYSQYVDLYGNPIPTEGPINAGATQPANWYVNGTTGNDTNDGRTPSTAFKTIRAATEVACCDTIHVAPGTYGENEGAQAEPSGAKTLSRVVVPTGVILKSTEGAEKTVILGAKCPPANEEQTDGLGCGVGAARCVYALNGAILRGFTLSGGRTISVPANQGVAEDLCGSALYAPGAFRARVEDCVITNNVAYDYTMDATDAIRCRIIENSTYNLAPAGRHCSWKNCFFDGLIGNRTLYNSVPPIENCTFGKNIYLNRQKATGAVIAVNEPGYCPQVALNSVFTCGGSFWITSYYSSQVSMLAYVKNCVINTGMALNETPADHIFNSQRLSVADIKIGSDGRPLAGSPVIDMGTNELASAEAILGDFDGAQRIQNGRIDAGAFEYDWKPTYSKTLGRYISVTAAAPTVVLTDKVLTLESGAIEGTIEKAGLLAMDFAVAGTGKLRAYLNDTLRGTFSAGDTQANLGDVKCGDAFRIVYEPGTDDVGDATVAGLSIRSGLLIYFR